MGAFLLSFSQEEAYNLILFEVASALGTVGLSMGITGGLSLFSKCVIIALMFIGRVGVLTFGFALFARQIEKVKSKQVEDDIAV